MHLMSQDLGRFVTAPTYLFYGVMVLTWILVCLWYLPIKATGNQPHYLEGT